MYKIDYNKKVKKFLLSHREIAKSFYIKLLILKVNPFSDKLDVKKIKGKNNEYRLRIGKYRFLFSIIDDKIFIYFYDAYSRGDIYK